MRECQYTVSRWADDTFGCVFDAEHSVRRAVEEMREFIELYEANDLDPRALGTEAADVVITLFRLASVLRIDLMEEVDRKMKVNRTRRWQADGTGHGYHVKEPA